MSIYDVKVCRFVSIERNTQYENICRLNRSNFITHYCVVDFTNFVATDIFTFESFRILRKNFEGRILESEKIELNQDYAVYVNHLNLNQLSVLELWKVRIACLKFKLLQKTSNRYVDGKNKIKR